MNILAHTVLSGPQEAIILGNFIGDFIKGDPAHEKHGLPAAWQQGVRLHRRIDTLTDEHPISAGLRTLLHPYCHKYAGVALDLIYDHFLALTFQTRTGLSLEPFVDSFYAVLTRSAGKMPPPAQRLAEYMIRGNWLVGYQTLDGLDRALRGMTRRTVFPSHLDQAMVCLTANYAIFADGFAAFFPVLQQECDRWLEEAANSPD
ncbi:acyl carrier protein phosphodiesterase [Tellurirhabdus rosea]|uniref:acyl carrier protein phosphodiesterase n=1 Tax=Tellurirhabdus rosea TaxID=2674997 RepID=UPI00224CD201|nr:ACP phosphodiesterase [Tellurirhabdus rosea]